MGIEIDLLRNYPKSARCFAERNTDSRGHYQQIARKFDKAFFDGERSTGYGGYYYNPKFWQPVIPTIRQHFDLSAKSRVLDIGCGKGFFLYDLALAIPGIQTYGIDISEYAISNALDNLSTELIVGNANNLPYDDSYFDFVISINTIHNLDQDDLILALAEIERVSRGQAFITVDAYRTKDEKQQIHEWNLTAKTICHVDEWRELFLTAGYTGDYYWFFP